jgi:uncharacterized RDD family membrane protein YckC
MRRLAILTCEKCGAEIAEGASFCAQCGKPLSVAQIGPVYVPQNAQPPEVIPAIADVPVPRALPAFAGFWLRAVACVIDTILIVSLFILVASFFPSTFEKLLPPASATFTNMPPPSPIVVLVLVCLGCLYYTVFEASGWQATPGKRIMRLYVTDLNGKRITFGRALIRNLARQLSGVFFIGYAIAGFTEKKQALHDILSRCLVLRRR